MATKRVSTTSARTRREAAKPARPMAREERLAAKSAREQAAATKPSNTSRADRALAQIDALDSRLGRGKGAASERERLTVVIANAQRKSAGPVQMAAGTRRTRTRRRATTS